MTWIYIAATIFGGAFLIPMVFGGLTSDLDGGFGGGVDGDVGTELDTGLELDGAGLDGAGLDGADFDSTGLDSTGLDGGGFFDGEVIGSIFSSLISFRTLVFFSGFFGHIRMD